VLEELLGKRMRQTQRFLDTVDLLLRPPKKQANGGGASASASAAIWNQSDHDFLVQYAARSAEEVRALLESESLFLLNSFR
jgi:hypothetical protein